MKLVQLFGAETADPSELQARITTRAEGNPFYIEELINYLHDRGIDPADPAALAALAIPESLQQLLISRLDQLTADEQNTVKVASVIGRLFKAAWLWGSYPELGAPETVQAHLTRLSRLDITPLDQAEPELEYLFKHMLTRDVAYESLAYSTRAQLHAAIGAHIERTYAGDLDRWLDLLAYHYGLSTDSDKQREYFRRAGAAAQAAYANDAAISYYQRLLPLLDAAQQIPVMVQLGQAWQLIGKWDAAEAIYREALTLTEQGATAGTRGLPGGPGRFAALARPE